MILSKNSAYQPWAKIQDQPLSLIMLLFVSGKNQKIDLRARTQPTRAWSYQQKITENFREIWPNFLFSGNSYRFPNLVPIKISGNFFQESVQLAAPKNLARNFSGFTEKNWWFKIFWFSWKMFLFPRKIFRPENLCL